MNVRALGEYIRNQRKTARLSLQKISSAAGVSVPYLSQIERGLRKPSAEILQAIAKGLRISAETLYVQAGFLEDRPIHDVATAILSDPAITERQKQALIQIYEAFREGARRSAVAPPRRRAAANRTPAPARARSTSGTGKHAAARSSSRGSRSARARKAEAG